MSLSVKELCTEVIERTGPYPPIVSDATGQPAFNVYPIVLAALEVLQEKGFLQVERLSAPGTGTEGLLADVLGRH